jgi:hypothetical protein
VRDKTPLATNDREVNEPQDVLEKAMEGWKCTRNLGFGFSDCAMFVMNGAASCVRILRSAGLIILGMGYEIKRSNVLKPLPNAPYVRTPSNNLPITDSRLTSSGPCKFRAEQRSWWWLAIT